MAEKTDWLKHPEFPGIKAAANRIVRILDQDPKSFKSYLKSMRECSELYSYLVKIEFIAGFSKSDLPVGINSDASIVLPVYAFRDYFIGSFQDEISNHFAERTSDAPEESPLTDYEAKDLVETLRAFQNTLILQRPETAHLEKMRILTISPEATVERLIGNPIYEGVIKIIGEENQEAA